MNHLLVPAQGGAQLASLAVFSAIAIWYVALSERLLGSPSLNSMQLT
jgi:hypothetical protein